MPYCVTGYRSGSTMFQDMPFILEIFEYFFPNLSMTTNTLKLCFNPVIISEKWPWNIVCLSMKLWRCSLSSKPNVTTFAHFGWHNVVEFESPGIYVNVATSILVKCKKPAKCWMWGQLTKSILVGNTPGEDLNLVD